VTPRVSWRNRATLVVAGRGADEPLGTRPGQRPDGGVEPELRDRRSLALARPEAGTPEQALGLLTPEGSGP